MWMLASPDGKLKVTVAQKENGGLYYAVSRDGKEVLAESGLGICTDLGDFTTGLAFEKEERNSVREKYSLPAGKKRFIPTKRKNSPCILGQTIQNLS